MLQSHTLTQIHIPKRTQAHGRILSQSRKQSLKGTVRTEGYSAISLLVEHLSIFLFPSQEMKSAI